MPRLNIIILERDRENPRLYTYALWADVPATRQPFYALAWGPTRVSAWKDALAADNTALQNGSVVEDVQTLQVPVGATLAQIQGFLQDRWTAYQTDITTTNPWQRYGTTWNGTTWVNGGVG
jgi:hypothetical protein